MRTLEDLEVMFKNPDKNLDTCKYLYATKRRGVESQDHSVFDALVNSELKKFPTQPLSSILLRVQSYQPIGESLISRGKMQASYKHIKAHRLRVTYTSNLCCQIEISERLNLMRQFCGQDIINFDETSCSRDKFRYFNSCLP